jgi:hypothetical protein
MAKNRIAIVICLGFGAITAAMIGASHSDNTSNYSADELAHQQEVREHYSNVCSPLRQEAYTHQWNASRHTAQFMTDNADRIHDDIEWWNEHLAQLKDCDITESSPIHQ